MRRKLALSVGIVAIVLCSATLAGGWGGPETGFEQGRPGPGGAIGFLWWGTHEPIYIYGNEDFTPENGVLSGCGTAEDPYIIEGWRIDAPHVDYGFYIDHTTAHFIIRDCVVEKARIAGVYLNSVRNGVIEDVQIARSDTAVEFLNSYCNVLQDSVIEDCCYGVVMSANSQHNVITANSFIANGQNGIDFMRTNHWYFQGVGNYWSNYFGCDRDGNGIGDTPHYPLWDPCPLMAPPVTWTGVTQAELSYKGVWTAPDGSRVVTSEHPIHLVAEDEGAGLSEIRYVVGYGEWMTYTGPIHLKGEDGPRRICYYGVDQLGNAGPVETISFFLDNHAPMTRIMFGEPVLVNEQGAWVTSQTKILFERMQESTFGRTITYYRVDSRGWRVYDGPFVLHAADGVHQISYYSRNASGVAEDLQIAVLHKDDTPPRAWGYAAGSPGIQVVVGDSSEPTQSSSVGDESSASETPGTTEPESVELEAAEIVEPDVIEPETPADPEVSDSATEESTNTEPMTTEPEATEPEVTEPANDAEQEPADSQGADSAAASEDDVTPPGTDETAVQTPTATLPEETPEVVPDPETQTESNTTDDGGGVMDDSPAEPGDAQTESDTVS